MDTLNVYTTIQNSSTCTLDTTTRDELEGHFDSEREEEYECHVEVEGRLHKFLRIKWDKSVVECHCITQDISVGDVITRINQQTVEEISAEEAASKFKNCLHEISFQMSTRHVVDDQCSEKRDILITMATEMCRVEQCQHFSSPRGHVKYYTRHRLDSRPLPDHSLYLIKTKNRIEPKYVCARNGAMSTEVLTNLELYNLEEYTARLNPFIVRYRKKGVVPFSLRKNVFTFTWGNQRLNATPERGIFLEEVVERDIPPDEAYFRLLKTESGYALESFVYMYFYVAYNPYSQELVFTHKRPDDRQNLGKTRRRAPDECRFDMITWDKFSGVTSLDRNYESDGSDEDIPHRRHKRSFFQCFRKNID